MSLATAINLAMVTPFKQSWTPIMWKMRGKPDEAAFHSETMTYYSLVQVFVLCGVVVFADLGMSLLSGGKPEFTAVALVVPLLYLGTIFFGMYDVMSAVCFEGKTHYYTISVFASAACSVLLNILLIPRLGPWGCAVAYACSNFVFAMLSRRFGKTFFSVSFEWGKITVGWVLGAVALGVGLLARQAGGALGFAVGFVVLALLAFALTRLIERSEFQQVRELF